ncbi:MAG TPA: class I SAM-dependent methyltransferase [Bacteroidales bacterium]|nr:class I SAM-dependent methyltransferase [Bacteroidales bacterium]HRZ21626.1 class I SAM-dependent methyltransferase [Bacteroidales bacterium]
MPLHLKPDREKSLLRRHPWVFSGAIQRTEGGANPGQTVDILSGSGKWMARGAISPGSQITARVWTFDQQDMIDDSFFFRRIEKSVSFRKKLYGGALPDACRLVYAESDGLPGLIADKYGDFLVCQFLSAGAEYWKESVVQILHTMIPCKGIFERSDADVRTKEGLRQQIGVLWGKEPPEQITVKIGSESYPVDVRKGHKTGFYLDQTVNREVVLGYSKEADVLNCFCYTGSFTAAALAGGAVSVTSVDTSEEALQLARQTISINGLDANRAVFMEDDVFRRLRRFRDEGRSFDLIILDPPKFAESMSQVEKAGRGYKDINLLAFKLLRPEGILITFSCSGLVTRELFGKIVADAALDAGKEARILQWLTQAPDHPVMLHFPEGMYLKGMVVKISD